LVTGDTAWADLGDNFTDKAYCFSENNVNSIYGAYYTYAAALEACPTGWHLPSIEEWATLENYISNDGHRGSEVTALRTTSGWFIDGTEIGTDNYGFSALPGAARYANDGSFGTTGYFGYWWTSTYANDSESAYLCKIGWSDVKMDIHYNKKSSGYSVRCLRDN
jgi:uncharacterized protein (TIGR02145 family)